jgi:hypothetical protein
MQDFRIGRGRLDSLTADLTATYAQLEDHVNAYNHYSTTPEMRHYFGALIMDDKTRLRRIRRRISRLLIEIENHIPELL